MGGIMIFVDFDMGLIIIVVMFDVLCKVIILISLLVRLVFCVGIFLLKVFCGSSVWDKWLDFIVGFYILWLVLILLKLILF